MRTVFTYFINYSYLVFFLYILLLLLGMELKVCSFNCCSLRKNINVIRKLTEEKYDIIFLQETFITDEKLGELDYIDDHYQSVGVGAKLSQKKSCLNGWTSGRWNGVPMENRRCL